MPEQDKWIGVIQDLVETCRDGEEGYREAALHIEDPELHAFFNDQCTERKLFARELEDHLSHLGRPGSKPGSTMSGALHRTWIGLKNALGGSDNAILGSVEQGEHAAVEAYQKALKQSLPEGIQQTIRAQLQSISAAQDYVQAARHRRKIA